MHIRRVILQGVRNFKDFDRSFEDSWTGRVPDSLLLIGPNGSGKSTLLGAIADLWHTLEHHLRQNRDSIHPPPPWMVLPANFSGLAALEIIDLEAGPLWICAGSQTDCMRFLANHSESHRVASLPVTPEGMRHFIHLAPGAVEKDLAESTIWQFHWSERLTKNILGAREDLPNLVFLESETRVLLPVEEEFDITREEEEYRWLARYQPTTSRKGSLQNYLYHLKVVDNAAFRAITDQINQFLVGKRLHGFDRRTGKLLVAVDGDGQHPIEDLSSGEKQVLLMLAAITRWLRPDGIVLIDEPDLHLHPSLMTAFVGHLRRMVAGKKGQLILASHAPDLRRDFTQSHVVNLPLSEERVQSR